MTNAIIGCLAQRYKNTLVYNSIHSNQMHKSQSLFNPYPANVENKVSS
jgi:hypothetical protein